MPNVTVLGGGTFGRGRALVNGISGLLQETPERSLTPFHHVRTQ